MMSSDVRPLAVTGDLPNSDEADAHSLLSPGKPYYRRRCCVLCCGVSVAIIILLAVLIVVLAVTVFKVREPRMTMNSLTLQQLNIRTSPSITVNMTVVADVSVKNPNAASFKFGGSTTSLYYRDTLIGVVYGGPGSARAHRTLRMNVTVDVMADRLGNIPSLSRDLISGTVGLQTSTKVGGRVKILGIFKRHVDVEMNCTMNVALASQKVTDQNCHQHIQL